MTRNSRKSIPPSTSQSAQLPRVLVENSVAQAIAEDIGLAGDITTQATIPAAARASVEIKSRQTAILAGMDLAREAFSKLDSGAAFKAHKEDGQTLEPGTVIAQIHGNARAILTAERTALNFLMHLSGIATLTHHYASTIAHTMARVCCTRKTTPGLRSLEKYAVRCGGGANHRYRLDDAILIKDNHIGVAGSIVDAINAARNFAGHMVKVEVEVDTLKQLEEAFAGKPDIIMLDNMNPEQLRQAVEMNQQDNHGNIKLEASGNVDLDTIQAIAETGVDLISTSKITMAAPPIDIGLDIAIE